MPISRKEKYRSSQSGEAGFTMVELVIVLVLTSILGTFIFQIVTNSLNTLVTMRTRKERSDDAILVLEKISREVREAKIINSTGNNILIFEKNATSSADTNKFVRFVRDTSTDRLRRQSAATLAGLPDNSTSGDIIAENVTVFSVSSETGSAGNRVAVNMDFSGGSEWETNIYPRNYGLDNGGNDDEGSDDGGGDNDGENDGGESGDGGGDNESDDG